MKTIHPENVSNEDLVKALVSNLRCDSSKDVSIITDELLRRLAAQQSVQADVCPACKGVGYMPGGWNPTCGQCAGTGKRQ